MVEAVALAAKLPIDEIRHAPDEMLTWQTAELQKLALGHDAYTVYVRPELVVEIAFNDIQGSPRYPGGLALRFARVKRYRPDKQPEDADTIETVRTIYERRLKARALDIGDTGGMCAEPPSRLLSICPRARCCSRTQSAKRR